jgi:hypothetical protein
MRHTLWFSGLCSSAVLNAGGVSSGTWEAVDGDHRDVTRGILAIERGDHTHALLRLLPDVGLQPRAAVGASGDFRVFQGS